MNSPLTTISISATFDFVDLGNQVNSSPPVIFLPVSTSCANPTDPIPSFVLSGFVPSCSGRVVIPLLVESSTGLTHSAPSPVDSQPFS